MATVVIATNLKTFDVRINVEISWRLLGASVPADRST